MRTAGIAVGLAVVMALGLGAGAPIAASKVRRLPGAVVLAPRDQAGLTRFIGKVSDHRSPSYGRYLRPGEFAARFGPSVTTVEAIEAQLRARGLRVGSVSAGRSIVAFSGPAAEVSAMTRPPGARHALLAGLSGPVAAVVGTGTAGQARLHGVLHSVPSQVARHRAARAAPVHHPPGSPDACRAARAASVAADGLTDDQIGNAYGAFGLYGVGDRGAGQRIAIYENEPFLRSDIQTFDTCYFGARQASAMQRRLHVVAVDGGQPTGPGTGEASLDVEDVSALAPGATIDVYEGPYTGANPTDYDSLNEYAAIIGADRDRVVSTSWGLCEQSVQNGQTGLQQAENLLFQQAAAQGQTVFESAGDNGSDDCNTNGKPTPVKGQNPLSVEDPASQPYVVSVGGTAIDDARQPPLEQAWNGGPRGGAGGGGISQSWPMPAWQRTSRVPGIAFPGGADYREANAVERAFGYPPGFCQTTAALASAAPASAAPASGAARPVPCRLLPDVSAEADPYTGSISVYSRSYAGTSFSRDGWTTIGGTSSAAPLWAAALALINASPACAAARSTRSGVGFVSPQLYGLASDPVRYRSSFHDITAGNNDVDGVAGTRVFAARRGYDLATGLGSPQLTGAGGTAGLAYYLCASARATPPVVSHLSPSEGDIAGGQKVTITGSGFGRGVSAVQIGTRRLISFRVQSPTSIVGTLPPARALVAPASPAPQDGAGPAAVIVVSRDGRASAPAPAATFDYVDSSPTGPLATVDAIAPSGGLRGAPRPVTILGSGMQGATRVTFGAVAAPRFRVAGPDRIVVTPPAYSSATACAPLPATGAYRGESAADDICQVAVRVINRNGASAIDRIPSPYEGAMTTDALGDIKLPPGCGCEGVTAPDEYDYVPAPRITSVSTSGGPASLASEAGGTVITIHGRGLNPLVLDWADFGAPGNAASEDIDYVYLSGTKMQIKAPGQRRTVDRKHVRLSVKTLAGQSPPAQAIYAGVPRVVGVASLASRVKLHGLSGAPDTGGTPIRITGHGLGGQLAGPLEFIAPRGLSAGTHVTVGGANLGCPLGVWFGRRAALTFRPGIAALDCGATQLLTATSPPGMAGSGVRVSVETVESHFTGRHRATTVARFRYRH